MSSSLVLYNSFTKKKEKFQSLSPKVVKMYVCGPTVYDLLHVGNFRGLIFFNVLRNWLEYLGYSVTYVYNYTDIDDKIIKKSKDENISAIEISKKFINEFEKDFSLLKIPKASFNPKCTDYIDDIVIFITDLINKKVAYEKKGSVFFSIDKFSNYGQLSGKNIEDLISGHRVNINPHKKNPIDFILWKPSKKDEPGWESPWGIGRPGWHIECSVMSYSLLGDEIDIHGGGMDLIFPHHENEIAQSQSRFGKNFSKYWIHNNFIKFDDQKMSKSLGNIIKARDFMNDYSPEILKFIILSVHYRSPLNFNYYTIKQSILGLIRIYSALDFANKIVNENKNDFSEKSNIFILEFDKIILSMNHDINTPNVYATIFDVVRTFNSKLNNSITKSIAIDFISFFKKIGNLLGLFCEEPEKFLNQLNLILLKEKEISLSKLQNEIKKRNKARQNKDYKEADLVRDNLLKLGIELKDSINGTTWFVRI